MIPFLPVSPGLSSLAPDAGTGLSAVYFEDLGNNAPTELSGTVFAERVEGPINFDYLEGGGSSPTGEATLVAYPRAIARSTDWAAKWTGRIYAPTAGLYTFKVPKDDGACLKINGSLVLSIWGTDTTAPEGIMELTAGFHDIYLAYCQRPLSGAYVQLLWKRPGTAAFTLIPAANLYPV